MRSFLLAGLGCALLLTVGIAAPVHADTTTTSDVPIDTVIPVPAALPGTTTSLWNIADPHVIPTWTSPGALTLPLAITLPAAGSYANALVVPAAPAGCSRVINSYTYTFSVTANDPMSLGGPVNDAMGSPQTNFVSAASVPGQMTWTLLPSAPMAPSDARFIYQIFTTTQLETTTLLAYSANVTDTCPSAVTPPAEEPAGLPGTGAEILPLGLGALALLLSGLAFLGSRRISRAAGTR